jgi:hypothetical protein
VSGGNPPSRAFVLDPIRSARRGSDSVVATRARPPIDASPPGYRREGFDSGAGSVCDKHEIDAPALGSEFRALVEKTHGFGMVTLLV